MCPHCGGAKPRYGFGRLEIGEQLLLPFGDRENPQKSVIMIRRAAHSFADRYARVFRVTTKPNGALVKRVA